MSKGHKIDTIPLVQIAMIDGISDVNNENNEINEQKAATNDPIETTEKGKEIQQEPSKEITSQSSSSVLISYQLTRHLTLLGLYLDSLSSTIKSYRQAKLASNSGPLTLFAMDIVALSDLLDASQLITNRGIVSHLSTNISYSTLMWNILLNSRLVTVSSSNKPSSNIIPSIQKIFKFASNYIINSSQHEENENMNKIVSDYILWVSNLFTSKYNNNLLISSFRSSLQLLSISFLDLLSLNNISILTSLQLLDFIYSLLNTLSIPSIYISSTQWIILRSQSTSSKYEYNIQHFMSDIGKYSLLDSFNQYKDKSSLSSSSSNRQSKSSTYNSLPGYISHVLSLSTSLDKIDCFNVILQVLKSPSLINAMSKMNTVSIAMTDDESGKGKKSKSSGQGQGQGQSSKKERISKKNVRMLIVNLNLILYCNYYYLTHVLF